MRVVHENDYIESGYYKKYVNGKKVWVHRHNAEKKIRRKLQPHEKVHHVDGEKFNNSDENLYVCKDRADHGNVHASLEGVAFELVRTGVIKFNHNTGEYYLQ